MKKSYEEALDELSGAVLRKREQLGMSREEHAIVAGVPISTIHYLRDGLTRDKAIDKPSREEVEKALDSINLTGAYRMYINRELLDVIFSVEGVV